MTAPSDEAAVVLDELLGKGLDQLSHEEREDLRERLEKSKHRDLAQMIESLLAGESEPRQLVLAYTELRRLTIASLTAPKLGRDERQGRKLDRKLASLNMLTGAPAPRRIRGGLLERIALLPAHAVDEPIEGCSDVAMLWSLVRAGRIAERRAAVRRIGHLAREGQIAAEGLDDRDLLDGLSAIRDPRIAYEVDISLASIPGAIGRAARQRRTRVDRLLTRVEQEARKYWSGDLDADPLQGLSREESLRLGVWLRRASDELAAHVAEQLRIFLAHGESSRLVDAIGALIPSGDERLVPTLGRILADGPLSARIATARALGRIADPRVAPALVKAYRHATDITEKTVLGGALGQHGDARALDFLLRQFEEDEPVIWEEVVRSIGSIGSADAASHLVPLLEHDRSTLVRATARALVRCAGVAELRSIQNILSRGHELENVLSDAAEAIALRLQLMGKLEENEQPKTLPIPNRSNKSIISQSETTELTTTRRFQSWVHYLLGLLWSVLWQRSRALLAFNAAARAFPKAPAPYLHEANIHAANNRDDLAIISFRRALSVNKKWVLRRPTWVQRMLRSYLRRADALVARRRKGEALALLDEVASLDLRIADLDLRLAMTRRRDRLLVDRARRRLTQ